MYFLWDKQFRSIQIYTTVQDSEPKIQVELESNVDEPN